MKNKLIISLVIVAAVLVGVGYAAAQSVSFSERLVQVAGTVLGKELAASISEKLGLDISADDSFGAAGDTYTGQKSVQEGADVTTTTPCSFYNGSDRDRFITRQYSYFNSLETTEGADITLTTASSSYGGKNESNTNYAMNQAFSTTTGYAFLSSTTPQRINDPTDDVKFVWPASSYFNFYLSGLASSTSEGVCGVEYISE